MSDPGIAHPATRLREAAKQTRLASDGVTDGKRYDRLRDLAADLEAYADALDDREGGG